MTWYPLVGSYAVLTEYVVSDPGRAALLTYGVTLDDQVFAVELKAEGRVARLAHTHSLVDDDRELDYWAEPHASANSDLTRIVFGTNWGRSGSGLVEMFMIALPPDWPERLSTKTSSVGP